MASPASRGQEIPHQAAKRSLRGFTPTNIDEYVIYADAGDWNGQRWAGSKADLQPIDRNASVITSIQEARQARQELLDVVERTSGLLRAGVS